MWLDNRGLWTGMDNRGLEMDCGRGLDNRGLGPTTWSGTVVEGLVVDDCGRGLWYRGRGLWSTTVVGGTDHSRLGLWSGMDKWFVVTVELSRWSRGGCCHGGVVGLSRWVVVGVDVVTVESSGEDSEIAR